MGGGEAMQLHKQLVKLMPCWKDNGLPRFAPKDRVHIYRLGLGLPPIQPTKPYALTRPMGLYTNRYCNNEGYNKQKISLVHRITKADDTAYDTGIGKL
jgi:hypothetical protein